MKKQWGLTHTELEIMEYVWDEDRILIFKEILDHFNRVYQKNWKKQTLSTYLIHLQNAGLIQADTSQKNYKYSAAISKKMHIHQWTKELVQDSFQNSLANFILAFTGGDKLTEEEFDELKNLI